MQNACKIHLEPMQGVTIHTVSGWVSFTEIPKDENIFFRASDQTLKFREKMTVYL